VSDPDLKHIAIIGSAGIPARYGGFETLAEKLSFGLLGKFKITVFCSGDKASEKDHEGIRLKTLSLKANGISSIPYDIISMWQSLSFADVYLVLGVSGGLFLPFVRCFTSKKIIVHVDGIAQSEKFSLSNLADQTMALFEKYSV